MDAPRDKEDCAPFVNVADLFHCAGVHVPTIYAQNKTQGFLLLSDMGNQNYLDALKRQPDVADDLYRDACQALLKIQVATQNNALPAYDHAQLLAEINLFAEWYIARHHQISWTAEQQQIWQTISERIVQRNLSEAAVYVHRDYHSRNLMVSTPNPGILDFQDAVIGPITYDLVSLFRDAYIEWDEARQIDWLVRYWQDAKKIGLAVPADFSVFYENFEWMGLQRHLKVLGIFARLYYRDGKASYLADLPQVERYVIKTITRYSALHSLFSLMPESIHSMRTTGVTF